MSRFSIDMAREKLLALKTTGTLKHEFLYESIAACGVYGEPLQPKVWAAQCFLWVFISVFARGTTGSLVYLCAGLGEMLGAGLDAVFRGSPGAYSAAAAAVIPALVLLLQTSIQDSHLRYSRPSQIQRRVLGFGARSGLFLKRLKEILRKNQRASLGSGASTSPPLGVSFGVVGERLGQNLGRALWGGGVGGGGGIEAGVLGGDPGSAGGAGVRL
jgi:hypothetical protein